MSSLRVEETSENETAVDTLGQVLGFVSVDLVEARRREPRDDDQIKGLETRQGYLRSLRTRFYKGELEAVAELNGPLATEVRERLMRRRNTQPNGGATPK